MPVRWWLEALARVAFIVGGAGMAGCRGWAGPHRALVFSSWSQWSGWSAGWDDDLAPELVLREARQRLVAQSGVLGAADAALAPGPPAVPQLRVSELSFGAA